MKPRLYLLLLVAIIFTFQNAYSDEGTCTATKSGNWNSGNQSGRATWNCTGTATAPEQLTGASTVIIPDGVILIITTPASWYANVIVKTGAQILFGNKLNLGLTINCGYTLTIEEGAKIQELGSNGSNRLYICGAYIISGQPPQAISDPTINWLEGGFLGATAFGEGGQFIPLPVELLDFKATSAQNQVVLDWSTASEQINDYFTLEKSKNGIDFLEIGKVAGNGTTNLVSEYSFVDNSPHLGLSYYRLSQTDVDGTTETFPAVSVVALNQGAAFSVSPNPVSNSFAKLKVSHRDRNELLELNIIDLQGKLVQKRVLKTDDFGNVETEIELKSQSRRGTYIFELVSKNNREYLKVTSN